MNILVTGSSGFIATHLIDSLSKINRCSVVRFSRKNNLDYLFNQLSKSDFIFHLAGVNRAIESSDFYESNVRLTYEISSFLMRENIHSSIYYSSSIHAGLLSNYGLTKLAAEAMLLKLKNKNPVFIHRLPAIFGPGSRPNYNSVIATFCDNVRHGRKNLISNPNAIIKIMYVGDLVKVMCDIAIHQINFDYQKMIYEISLRDLDLVIRSFKGGQSSLCPVLDENLINKLHLTYLNSGLS